MSILYQVLSKRYTRLTETFLTNFQLFEEFWYQPNFYFLWPTILSELVQMNCACCERLTTIVKEDFLLETI